jgi:hypothetical protein
MKKIVAILLALMIILTSSAVFAKDKPDAGNIIGDMVILRPIGVCTLVIGTAFFIVTLPIAAISQSTKQTAEVLVVDPFKFTFTRPLGEIESGL